MGCSKYHSVPERRESRGTADHRWTLPYSFAALCRRSVGHNRLWMGHRQTGQEESASVHCLAGDSCLCASADWWPSLLYLRIPDSSWDVWRRCLRSDSDFRDRDLGSQVRLKSVFVCLSVQLSFNIRLYSSQQIQLTKSVINRRSRFRDSLNIVNLSFHFR